MMTWTPNPSNGYLATLSLATELAYITMVASTWDHVTLINISKMAAQEGSIKIY